MGFKQSDMFPSKYLKAEEFEEGEERTVTIKDVRQEDFKDKSGKNEQKFVLDFRDEKSMVLNKTNAGILFKLLGDDTDDWFGRSVILYTMEVDSFGDIVRAVRIRNKLPTKGAVAAPAETKVDPMQPQTRAAIINRAETVWGATGAPEKLKGYIRGQFGKGLNGLSEFQANQVLEQLEKIPVLGDQDDDEGDPFEDA